MDVVSTFKLETQPGAFLSSSSLPPPDPVTLEDPWLNMQPKQEDPGLNIADDVNMEQQQDTVSKPESSATPPPPTTPSIITGGRSKSKRTPPPPPQIISHLPVATEEARRTFEEITENDYQYARLGRSREAGESMTCDCHYEYGVDEPSTACGDNSDCINRLTQVECLPGDCRCKAHCQNQRFQKRQYADIEVVQTEKKGFGLRARRVLKKDTFIYEYVGDVVSQPSFVKRMRDYAGEGIRHFYFMMLQKDEFIDATKRGGLGRFANHSCSPNCFVAKWFIGSHVRMGIFAKRSIQEGEELTFNYNVDRYGHDAQPCYCGEPNCVGFIGGKTQTDMVSVDDLYFDALGIDDDERAELKGNKRKKGKKLDDLDFMPILKPIPTENMTKVYQAIKQTQSKKVLSKVLTRITITGENQVSLREFLRLRGMSLLTNILEDNMEDEEIVMLTLQCLYIMPLLNTNKVDDSQIRVQVDKCATSDNDRAKELALKVLDKFDKLPVKSRIGKRAIGDDGNINFTLEPVQSEEPAAKKGKVERGEAGATVGITPLGKNPGTGGSFKQFKPRPTTAEQNSSNDELRYGQQQKSIQQVIAEARAVEELAEKQRLLEEEEEKRKQEEKAARRKARKEKLERMATKKNMTPEQKLAAKEKQLLKLISPIVVKTGQKFVKDMGSELFKKHARELSEKIAEKEKKSSSFKDAKLDKLSEEKVAKIKKFSKDYFTKEVHRLKKASRNDSDIGSRTLASSSSLPLLSPLLSGTPDSSLNMSTTPDSESAAGLTMDTMSVDDIMGFAPDDDEDMNIDDDSDVDDENGPGEQPLLAGALTRDSGSACTTPSSSITLDVTDPRKRPPKQGVSELNVSTNGYH